MGNAVLNTATIILGIFGVGLILAHYLLGRARGYLLYLGVAFIALAASFPMPASLRWLPLLLSLVAVYFAIREGLADTRARLRKFREEQQQRESAYGEYLETLARNKPGDKQS